MFVLVSSLLFFLFGSVRQTKLATRQFWAHVNIVHHIIYYYPFHYVGEFVKQPNRCFDGKGCVTTECTQA